MQSNTTLAPLLKSLPQHWLKGCLAAALMLPVIPVHANNTAYSNSSTMSAQPAIKWYRYYNNKGEPSLSSTITSEHLRHGYEALDRNMQVVERFPPFSANQYEQDKAKRDIASLQQLEDIKLKRGYGSAAQATIKRDRELTELANHKLYLQQQLKECQIKQQQNTLQANNFNRQKKPVPPYLRNNMIEVDRNIANIQQNIDALSAQELHTKEQFSQVIRRLTQLEQQESQH